MTRNEQLLILKFVQHKLLLGVDGCPRRGLCHLVLMAMREMDIACYTPHIEEIMTELGLYAYKPSSCGTDDFWWHMDDFETRLAIVDVLIANLVNVPLPLTLDKG